MTREWVVDKCRSHVADALEKGAGLLTSDRPLELGRLFVRPTLLADVTEQMRISEEETFGPVLPVLRFDSEEEVIVRANQRDTGLVAYAPQSVTLSLPVVDDTPGLATRALHRSRWV